MGEQVLKVKKGCGWPASEHFVLDNDRFGLQVTLSQAHLLTSTHSLLHSITSLFLFINPLVFPLL